MKIKIQVVEPTNRELLDNVAEDVFDNEIDQQSLAAFLEDPRHLLVVAIVDGCVVGMASGFEYFHPDKPPQLFVNEVGVTPGLQRRGIGRRLVDRLLDVGRRRGCVYAWLGTAADNQAGRACFGSIPSAEGPEPFLLYEWDLTVS